MRTLKFTATLTVCFGLLFGACARGEEPPAPPGPPPVVRVPVPPAEKLAAAEKELKDIYKTEYAKTDNASRAAFGKELLKQAPGMKDDLAAAYVMLRDAREFATTGRDVETALAAAKMLGERFEVDAGELKTASFATVARQSLRPEDADKAFTAGLDLLDALEKDDRYDAIEKVSVGLESLRRTATSPALIAQAADRLKDIRARQTKWQSVKYYLGRLKEKPDDPDANLAVGRYYADAKKDVSKALPFLAKGSDAALKAVSQKDLANPADLEGRLAVGDAWWEAGEKETGTLKSALRLRAAFWYEQIVNDLTGLKKAVVQKRIDQANTIPQAGVRTVPLTWKEGVIRTLKAAGDRVLFVPASRLGLTRVRTGPEGRTYTVYDLETGEKVREIAPKPDVRVEALSPDGRVLLVAGVSPDTIPGRDSVPDMDYALVDLRTGVASPTKKWPFPSHPSPTGMFGPDGEPVAVGVDKGQHVVIRLRDKADAAHPIPGVGGGSFFWLPDRGEVLVYDGNKTVFYDAKTGRAKQTVALETRSNITWGQLGGGAVSPDGKLLLFFWENGGACNIAVLDAQKGKWLQSFPRMNETAGAKCPWFPVFLPDSRHVAAVCLDLAFRVWDVVTWKELYCLPRAKDYVRGRAYAVSGDGRFALILGGESMRLVGLPKDLWPGAGN